jgi:hypothetical protein
VSLTGIVQSISSGIWAAWTFVSGFGQAPLWVVLVGFFAVTMIASFRASRNQPRVRRARVIQEPGTARAAQWQAWLSLSGSRRGTPHALVRELRKLCLSVLAHAEGEQAPGLEARIRSGEKEAEECIRWLLEQGRAWEGPRPRLARGRRASGAEPDRERIEQVVQALERRLGAGETGEGA